jgi:hypothetical protein
VDIVSSNSDEGEEEEERHAMVDYLVKALNEELATELLEGFLCGNEMKTGEDGADEKEEDDDDDDDDDDGDDDDDDDDDEEET